MGIRNIQQRSVASIYYRLGTEVEYHHVGGVVSYIRAIDSARVEYTPSGYDSVVAENRTIYHVQTSDIPRPTTDDFIIDDGVRFDVVNPEPRNRYEWMLTVKEALT